MFKELNPLLHSELRLAVMSILVSVEEAEFSYLKQQTGATAGNLSVQIDKLNKADYVEVIKTFKGKMPSKPQWYSSSATPSRPGAYGSYKQILGVRPIIIAV